MRQNNASRARNETEIRLVVGSISWGSGISHWGWGGVTSLLLDHSVESVVLVSCVLDHSLATVSLDQGVETRHHVTITALMLSLDVSGVGVVDLVSEFILGVSVSVHFGRLVGGGVS